MFHLRGNQRTSGDVSRREGGKIFGSGSRAPIAISLLVKNPDAKVNGQIYFHDIGDYLTREEKLEKIREFGSSAGLGDANGWREITPDEYGDWLKQRDEGFSLFLAMGDKKEGGPKIFDSYSLGVATGRDAWCFNCSRQGLSNNMKRMIEFFGSELQRFEDTAEGMTVSARDAKVDGFVETNPKLISWSANLKRYIARGRQLAFSSGRNVRSTYRPFGKQWLYFDRSLNERVYQMPKLFGGGDSDNRAIMIKGNWRGKGQLAIIVDGTVCLQPDGGGQCFPLYLYDEEKIERNDDLFATGEKESKAPTRRDAITDGGLAHFREKYPAAGEGETISKEDLFYYVYGLLHSPDYRSRYADNLGKELPRIPAVKTFAAFMAFSQAGRELAHWHLNYESVAIHPGATLDTGKVPLSRLQPEDYRVTKMKFAKTKDPATGKSVNDKSTVIYNERITIRNIPLEAYDYVVNGKPALEWVMERQAVTTDKASGIVNDANLWATETMGDAKYPLELFLRVITVSLETMKIVNGLPRLQID